MQDAAEQIPSGGSAEERRQALILSAGRQHLGIYADALTKENSRILHNLCAELVRGATLTTDQRNAATAIVKAYRNLTRINAAIAAAIANPVMEADGVTWPDLEDAQAQYPATLPSGSAVWGGVTGSIASQSDLQAALDGKQASGSYEAANANIQAHVASAHAPAGAQANADITKAEIEAKLTGEISSHTHAGGGSFTLTTVEKDLGSVARSSGTFDITGLSGLTAGRPVLIQQASGPYTGKGDLADECEETVTVCASVLDATTIRAFWNSGRALVVGNFKFNYLPA